MGDCTCGRVWEGHPDPHAITCPSHGTPEHTAPDSTPTEREAGDVGEVAASGGVTANTWQSAARRLAEENRRLLERVKAAERQAEVNYRLADDRSAWKGGYDAMKAHAQEWERNSRNWQRRAEKAEADTGWVEAMRQQQRVEKALLVAAEWDATADRCERRYGGICCSACVGRRTYAEELRAALAPENAQDAL